MNEQKGAAATAAQNETAAANAEATAGVQGAKAAANAEATAAAQNTHTAAGVQGAKAAAGEQKAARSAKKAILQFLKFLCFSLSAGAIQLVSFELLYNWTGWLPWWPSYLIGISLSVLWNFTFNRKFTFASAGNVPLAMVLAALFYVAFVPASLFGGDALEAGGWNGTLVTLMMMVINFVGEFFWDKFVVFNDALLQKLFPRLHKKK